MNNKKILGKMLIAFVGIIIACFSAIVIYATVTALKEEEDTKTVGEINFQKEDNSKPEDDTLGHEMKKIFMDECTLSADAVFCECAFDTMDERYTNDEFWEVINNLESERTQDIIDDVTVECMGGGKQTR